MRLAISKLYSMCSVGMSYIRERKKMTILLVLSVVVIFVSMTGFSFWYELKNTELKHANEMSSVTKNILIELEKNDFSGMTPEQIVTYLYDKNYLRSPYQDYVSEMCMIDMESSELYQNGSCIDVEDEDLKLFVPLNQYITPEMKKQIKAEYIDAKEKEKASPYGLDSYLYDSLHEYGEWYLIQFDYYLDPEDLIIPCTLWISTHNDATPENSLELRLSETLPNHTISRPQGTKGKYEVYLDNSACFVSRFNEGKVLYTYNELTDNINEMFSFLREEYPQLSEFQFDFDKYREEDLFTEGTEVVSDSFKTFEFDFWIRRINGKYYIITLATSLDQLRSAMNSAEWLYIYDLIKIITLVIGVLSFIIVNYYYSKDKKLADYHKSFTSAAAHELKTPVAIMQGQCELILYDIDPDNNKAAVESMYDEVQRMKELVENFLEFNRLSSLNKVEMMNESISDVVFSEVEKYSEKFNEASINLSVEINDDIKAECNRKLICLSIDNLLSNAVKYVSIENEKVPEVKICLKKVRKNRFKFSVYNDCVKDHIPNTSEIWRFGYRGSRVKPNFGTSTKVGLPITASIMKLHKYKYGCNAVEHGIEFYFEGKSIKN